jgi:hypothetical protein
MDDHIHPDGESGSVPLIETPSWVVSQIESYLRSGTDAVDSRYTGPFFPNSRHLVVVGGAFTSYNSIVTVPPGTFTVLWVYFEVLSNNRLPAVAPRKY